MARSRGVLPCNKVLAIPWAVECGDEALAEGFGIDHAKTESMIRRPVARFPLPPILSQNSLDGEFAQFCFVGAPASARMKAGVIFDYFKKLLRKSILYNRDILNYLISPVMCPLPPGSDTSCQP